MPGSEMIPEFFLRRKDYFPSIRFKTESYSACTTYLACVVRFGYRPACRKSPQPGDKSALRFPLFESPHSPAPMHLCNCLAPPLLRRVCTCNKDWHCDVGAPVFGSTHAAQYCPYLYTTRQDYA